MKLAAILFGLSAVSALRLAVFSDLHILPIYNPNVNNSCWCSTGCSGHQDVRADVASSVFAPLGRLYCDPPLDLADAFFQKLQLEQPDLDILLVTGDIVGHTYSQDLNQNFSEKTYDQLM